MIAGIFVALQVTSLSAHATGDRSLLFMRRVGNSSQIDFPPTGVEKTIPVSLANTPPSAIPTALAFGAEKKPYLSEIAVGQG